LLGDRIKVLSGSTEESERVFGELLTRANRTKTTIESLAGVYARFSAATKETGISTAALLDVVEVLQNSFRLAGSGFQEANSAAVQLSQGLASGQLRGQELRSVLEANVVIGDLLAKQFNVTRGQLYKLAEAGELTGGKVLVALLQNFEKVNMQASQLGQTFEQTTIVAFNRLKAAIGELNKDLDISGKFAKGVDLLFEKLTLISAVAVPAVIGALIAFRGQLVRTALTIGASILAINPYVALFSALGATIIVAFDNLKQFNNFLTFTANNTLNFFAKIALGLREFEKRFAVKGFTQELDANIEALKRGIAAREKANEALFSGDSATPQDEAARAAKEREEQIKKLLDAINNQTGKEEKLRDILGAVNRAYRDGKIDIAEYFRQLDAFEVTKLERGFRDGKIQLDKFNEGLLALENRQLSRELAAGDISLRRFNDAIAQNRIEELRSKFQAGVITLKEYDEQLNAISKKFTGDSAFRAGTASFIDSIGTLSQNVADSIKNAFSSLEETFLEFTKTGRADFGKFTQAILDDLLKIIIRASIIRPLAEGVLGAIGGGITQGTSAGSSYTNVSGFAAKGMAFDGGVRKFAQGGIVNRPTLFGYGQGKTGMMGEAGTEAILPLQRGAGGNLGVAASVTPVTINITNNSAAEVVETERSGPNGERTIEFMIRDKVREGIASGQFDRVMATTYGLNRRGS
jgi:lambda family phage tail tape measure protein